MQIIDCRGQACPAPVIVTKKALETSKDGITVLVDDGAPRENVTRFAHTRGYIVTEEPSETGWTLSISQTEATNQNSPTSPVAPQTGDRVLLLTSDCLGNGPEELGKLLMKNFIITLLETSQIPDRILFLNSGVLLAIKGAETAEALKILEERGVELLACGVCLDYFNKKDQLSVGRVTNMFSTAEHLLAAASVIRL